MLPFVLRSIHTILKREFTALPPLGGTGSKLCGGVPKNKFFHPAPDFFLSNDSNFQEN